LAGAFIRAGFSLHPWEAGAEIEPDMLSINTCTVTSRADQKARRLVRKALRDFPRACIIVTGCYAELDPGEIRALDSGEGGGLLVLKGGAKNTLLDLPSYLRDAVLLCPSAGADLRVLIRGWDHLRAETAAAEAGEGAFRFNPEIFSFHSRAFLKIQDGCDHHCTYCRVRLARGPSVSLDAAAVLSKLRDLEAGGYAEAVLTGVNITQYRGPDCDLAELLEYLLAGTRRIALRLSSLEPDGVSRKLAGALAHVRVRPHFHLSVQSGSPRLLAKMGRRYGPETVERAAALFRSVKDDPFLACDIITGFPGETETDFAQTLDLCQNTGFAWIHAFPYSKRPGTPAFFFTEPVSEREAADRVETLFNLARRGRGDYIRRWKGRETEVLLEEGAPRPGYSQGTSENYLKLMVPYSGLRPPLPGTVLRCRIGEAVNMKGLDAEAEAIAETQGGAD
jgi:threonylcarbamoyladenosine tRNA methylthiotransferase MtaB